MQFGLLKISNFELTKEILTAFHKYTGLVDYSSKEIVKLLKNGLLKPLYKYTQDKLSGDVYGTHMTQRLPFYFDDNDIESNRGVLFEVNDIMSFSFGQGVREYKKYQYAVIGIIPKEKILTSSKLNPELFSLHEDEIIVLGGTVQVTNIEYDRNGDNGNLIHPIRIKIKYIK